MSELDVADYAGLTADNLEKVDAFLNHIRSGLPETMHPAIDAMLDKNQWVQERCMLATALGLLNGHAKDTLADPALQLLHGHERWETYAQFLNLASQATDPEIQSGIRVVAKKIKNLLEAIDKQQQRATVKTPRK